MKTHGQASKLEAGQLAELGAKILRQLPHIPGLSETAQGWIENELALRNALTSVLVPSNSFKYDKAKEGWTLLEDVPSSTLPFTPDFVKFLKSGESSVNGNVMRQRAKELNANLGQRDLEWLLGNPHLIPESERGHYLVATGTVWRGSGGLRGVPCLGWGGVGWSLHFYWLGFDWDGIVRLVCQRG